MRVATPVCYLPICLTGYGRSWRVSISPIVSILRLHSYRLHPLKGDLKGYWSITVKANWRIIFRFRDGKALDVELIDYH